MQNTDFIDDIKEAKARQIARKGKNSFRLSEYQSLIQRMLQENVSLPFILDTIERKGHKTTITTLRRFVVRVFGRSFYDQYLYRNGWHKVKQTTPTSPRQPEKIEDKNLSNADRIRQAALAQMAESEKRFKLE